MEIQNHSMETPNQNKRSYLLHMVCAFAKHRSRKKNVHNSEAYRNNNSSKYFEMRVNGPVTNVIG